MQRQERLLLNLTNEFQEFKKELAKQSVLKKEILDIDEASVYINQSISSLYKLTSKSNLNYFKPNGKKIYFKRSDLDKWMLSKSEVSDEADFEKARKSVTELLKTIKS